MQAGAEGGLVALVHSPAQRIIGWYASSENGSDQGWTSLRAEVNFKVPNKDAPTSLPRPLVSWAQPVVFGDAEQEPSDECIDESVLETIIRTKHALFLTDQTPHLDYGLFGKPTESLIRPQVAIPLIASDDHVIGTIQIGLSKGATLTHEIFGFWISFAQKIAVALERAEERIQRQALEEINSLQNRFVHELSERSHSLEHVLEQYALNVQNVIEFDRVFLRTKQGRPPRYRDLRPSADAGTFDDGIHRPPPESRTDDWFPRNATFVNSGEAVREFLDEDHLLGGAPDINPIAGSHRSLIELESVALIPIRKTDPSTVLICGSRQPFFLTDFRCQLARAAAIGIERLLAEFDHQARWRQGDRLRNLRRNLVDPLIQAADLDSDWNGVLEILQAGFLVRDVTMTIFEHDEFYSTRDGRPELLAEIDDETESAAPVISSDELSIVAPVLSFSDPHRRLGLLGLYDKHDRTAGNFGFADQFELECVLEITRLLGSTLNARANRLRLAEFDAKLRLSNQLAASGLFATTVMHDLNTPLSQITRCLDVLRTVPDLSPTDRDREYTLIDRCKDKAVELIQRIAALPTMSKATYDISQAVTAALDSIIRDNEFPLVKITVQNRVHCNVRMDLWSIASALGNLISNAACAAAEDGGDVTIEVEEDSATKYVRIRILNSGRHYTKEQVDQFLVKGATTKKGRAHLGLGLKLSIHAFRDAGGECELRSAGATGVEAVCSLPLAESIDTVSTIAGLGLVHP